MNMNLEALERWNRISIKPPLGMPIFCSIILWQHRSIIPTVPKSCCDLTAHLTRPMDGVHQRHIVDPTASHGPYTPSNDAGRDQKNDINTQKLRKYRTKKWSPNHFHIMPPAFTYTVQLLLAYRLVCGAYLDR
jgi:hypothetical protein